MNTSLILNQIDKQIQSLQAARALLADGPSLPTLSASGPSLTPSGKRRGRPPGVKSKKAALIPAISSPIKRKPMSEEAKNKLRLAAKKRWKAAKKAGQTTLAEA
jgi:hypothetical protein